MIEATADHPYASGQLEREAARWCSLLHGPNAELHRAEFEVWLRRGALHRETYNRLEEIYLLAAKLPPRILADTQISSRSTRGRKRLATIGIPLALIGFTAIAVGRHGSDGGNAADLALMGPMVQLRLSTLHAAGQTFRLSDGSVVALGPDSELSVDYGRKQRHLRLMRGSSSFDVTHQNRPFVVRAGDATVTAHGTSFDVSILPRRTFRVLVHSGTVEVWAPSPTHPSAETSVRMIPADREKTFALSGDKQTDLPPTPPDAQPRTVGELISGANERAGAGPMLSVADPRLLDLRLGGLFRIHEPSVVAERLALMLDLVADSTPGRITLRSRRHRPLKKTLVPDPV